jgi:A/G-specific adenine glycosylase
MPDHPSYLLPPSAQDPDPGQRVAAWFAQHGRDLAWRQRRDPYAIWIAEVVLQQTRIAQGEAYLERFLRCFPTVEALAAAPLDAVLKAWEGLGYYTRAHNLHRAAQVVVQQHDGQLPATPAALQALPGVGPYTAHAVAAFAFGARVAVLDGNVFRVLARWHASDVPIDAANARRHYQPLAHALLGPVADPAAFNQGIMDLGSTVCTPSNPRCGRCPLVSDCAAHHTGGVADFPRKLGKAAPKLQYLDLYFVQDASGRFVLRQRDDSGYWKNLWELPTQVVAAHTTPDTGQTPLFVFKHQFTHLTLVCRVLRAQPNAYPAMAHDRWVGWPEAQTLALPKAIHAALERIRQGLRQLDFG